MLKQAEMIEKIYSIENFVYHKLPNDSIVVQSKIGIVKITNQIMIDFIQEIDNQELYRYLKLSFIQEVFGDKTDDALEFLSSYGIISDYEIDSNFKVQGYEFFSNDKGFIEIMKLMTKDDYENKKIDIKYHDSFGLIDFQDKNFICCFLNPYDKKLADDIVARAQESNCTLLMAYTYNNNIYINNLYKETWKNPCHFCNLGQIESQLRIQMDGNVTYQQLIDALYHEDPQFQVKLNLSNREIVQVITQVLQIVDEFILRDKTSRGYSSYNLNESIFINLLTNEVIKDFSIHWELCDCYE